jgi:DNA-binding response OmpR family regulator
MERPRILLVEDDVDISAFLAQLLDLEGFEPLVAQTGEKALALARGRVDAVLMDLAMPDLDGLEICRRLRAAGSKMPVIIVSARPGADVPRLAAEAGADEFLRKPFENADLVARLRRLLAAGPRRQ